MKLDEDYEDFFYVKIYLFFVHTSGEVWKKTYLLFVHPPGEVQGKGLTFFLLRERRWRPTFFLLIRLLKFKFKKIFFGYPDLFFFFSYLLLIHPSCEVQRKGDAFCMNTYLLLVHPPGEVQGKGDADNKKASLVIFILSLLRLRQPYIITLLSER